MIIRNTARYSLFFCATVLCDKCNIACPKKWYTWTRRTRRFGDGLEYHLCAKCQEQFNLTHNKHTQDDFEEFINA